MAQMVLGSAMEFRAMQTRDTRAYAIKVQTKNHIRPAPLSRVGD